MKELLLVTYCAPTLAGLKTGNLFACRYSDRGQLEEDISGWNMMFEKKDLLMRALKAEAGRALIYVYREKRLRQDLENPSVQKFLKGQGYPYGSTEQMLCYLSGRIKETAEFPHEIGLFLGYPFEDVKGFIENKGKNCKCVGCWKVYTDECEARKLFHKYRWCTEVYCKKLKEGFSIQRLAVTADK